MKDSRLNKALEDLRKVSLTSIEKKVMVERIFVALSNTSSANESHHVANSRPVKSPWTIYSFSQFIQSHRWASAVVVILIVAISGNSIVLAANESLPGDILYSIKVNVNEPIRVAITSDPVDKVAVQTQIVQTRFEEIETLAARGELNDDTEEQVAKLIDQHVVHLSENIAQVEVESPEKAEDANINAQASMNAHAKILSTIRSERAPSSWQSDRTSRIADKAREDSKKFEVRSHAIATASTGEGAVELMSSSAPVEDVPAARMSAPATGSAKMSAVTAPSTIQSVNQDTSRMSEPVDPIENTRQSKMSSDDNDDRYAVSDAIETKKREKEKEIYEKAREKLEVELKKEEIRTSRNKWSVDEKKYESNSDRDKGERDSKDSKKDGRADDRD